MKEVTPRALQTTHQAIPAGDATSEGKVDGRKINGHRQGKVEGRKIHGQGGGQANLAVIQQGKLGGRKINGRYKMIPKR